MNVILSELKKIQDAHICCGCGACAALDRSHTTKMQDTANGPVPLFSKEASFPEWALEACPAKGVNYPEMYQHVWGKDPDSWLFGEIKKVYTGFSADPKIRKSGASGGVITHILCYLLENRIVDAVIAAKQGVGSPLSAKAVILDSIEGVLNAAQSVYVPVSMLDILPELDPQKRYAITCLPEASSALRVMQKNGFKPAELINYVLGPYTGTALYPAAIECFLRSNRVPKDDSVTKLQWRAGAWPGYLQIDTAAGRVLKSPKVYYNYLIPFFVTQTSLQSMDFANEFADIAVGDAWNPKFEKEAQKGAGGQSVIAVRSEKMLEIVKQMQAAGLLVLTEEEPSKAGDMHGHMLDFKKRGGYLRNRWRRLTGRLAPDYGYKPAHIPPVRILVEVVISLLFTCGRLRFSRWVVAHIPETVIGPFFNGLRKQWKNLSRPTKRKGLKNFQIIKTKKSRGEN